MLSTNSRLKVEFICERIANKKPVEFADMTWIQKLSAINPSVDTKLRAARRTAIHGDPNQESMDGFCSKMDIGEPDPSDHLIGPQDPVTLAEWFSSKRRWFRGTI